MQPSGLRLDDQLCFALYAATNAVTRSYRPKLDKVGLTYPQYLVLLVLWQDGARTIRSIADRLHLPANAITPLIDRLALADLVVRRRDTDDRRVIHVHLTAAGLALETEVSLIQHDVVCDTQLDPEQLARLRTTLRDLVIDMEKTGINLAESR